MTRNMVFLYKTNEDDRDCCAYIAAIPFRFECGHYFGSPNICGACYCGSNWANYEEIRTVLTEEEYGQLREFSDRIRQLGSGIKKGDERYQKGVALCEAIQPVYDKLNSEENEKFFAEIVEEETEWLMDEYGLNEDDIEDIFNDYGLSYRDRSVIGCVFRNAEECGREEAESLGYVERGSWAERYFDFEKFGDDLLEEEQYYELRDGRVVYLNY